MLRGSCCAASGPIEPWILLSFIHSSVTRRLAREWSRWPTCRLLASFYKLRGVPTFTVSGSFSILPHILCPLKPTTAVIINIVLIPRLQVHLLMMLMQHLGARVLLHGVPLLLGAIGALALPVSMICLHCMLWLEQPFSISL